MFYTNLSIVNDNILYRKIYDMNIDIDMVFNPLESQRNKIIKVCLGKHSLEGSTLRIYTKN